jgi:hypothetical protein
MAGKQGLPHAALPIIEGGDDRQRCRPELGARPGLTGAPAVCGDLEHDTFVVAHARWRGDNRP